MKNRLSHIGSILVFTPVIFVTEWVIYALAGSKTDTKGQIKFIWDLMWEPIENDKM